MLTALYVPADRPDRVGKALAGDADVVLVDLEDAVAPDRKRHAREQAARLLATITDRNVQVRVNDVRTAAGDADLAMLAGLPRGIGVRLPKIEDADTVRVVAARLPGRALHPLLESALGVERAYRIATADAAVASIGLGEADLRADLGLPADADDGLAYPRSRVLVAARAAGLPAPAQSVYPNVRDLTGLAASCRAGRRVGFRGRAAIHPAQLPVIAAEYAPTEAELAAARAVLAVEDTGAAALPDGRFVDEAILRTARNTLRDARR
ncbi:CoA ester lyase [Actinocatenispora thailandica]|uniref:CoA ester lyase n=1 Tax=Actinocatenispora thailandica TaxID=227318 RepID=A0A7R7HXH6_9ACTN|nr:aldolase/citrate lyase family protein [Actinocatenispora thailandica]BCJ35751.1 CoA ester lyase [Actinocatenispora thailandica]